MSSNSRPAKTRRIGTSHSSSHSRSSSSSRSSSRSRNAGIVAYLEYKLSRIFPDLTISVDTDSGDIHGYSCIDQTKCECFNLSINHKENIILLDRVRYKYGDECSLTGTDIMTRLVRVFRTLDKNYKVQLYDRARVQLTDGVGNQHEILLSMHYIMQHGVPWYSKFGFKTPQYSKEMESNDAAMNKTVSPMLLKKINAHLDYALEKGTTFRQAAKMLFAANATLAYLELYNYLTDTKAKRLKYAYYDVWFMG